MSRETVATDRAAPELVARAAIALADEQGPGAVTFRAVAARLGVPHATLQRRVTDAAGLLDLCADQLAAELPDIPSGSMAWASATEARFAGLYRVMAAHPGLMALRGGRPWLGRHLLARLTEPQLADNLAAGLPPAEAVAAYRRMYLLTLGHAAFVDHRDPGPALTATRLTLAALEPAVFPALTALQSEVLAAVVDHEVYYTALRQLILATAVVTPAP
ncbi:TetR family transcriptional regulator [Streptomyces sp. 846.5]|nr:TetR family transcriptional regulator [Streptomyces sp. 846.5]TDU02378.1 TetR family transcriptional regulator [Streptomyces sp. 846.5]